MNIPRNRFTARDAAQRWRTLRVAVAGGAVPLEELLLGTVEPWIGKALAAGWTDSWYLTRTPSDPADTTPAQLELQFRNPDRRLSDLAVRIEAFFADQTGGRSPGDTVVEQAFTPAIERFGGEYGMAVSVAHQVAASRLSVLAIRNAPWPGQRLQIARRMLVGSALARCGDTPAAATWLRRFGRAQSGLLLGGRLGLRRAAAAAETDHRRDPVSWLRLFEGVRVAVASADDIGTWYRLQRHTWTELDQLHSAGLLTVAPDVVFGLLTQATHDRIGLRPADNARAALLMSMAADGDEQQRFPAAS